MAGPATLAAVPLMPRLTVGFAGSLLAMARQAPAGRAPEALGAKVTLRVALPPAITVNGTAGAQVTEPGVPGQDETPVRLSGAVPAFCTWVLSIFELPTVTIWKLSEVGLRAIAGVAVFVAIPPTPRLTVGFAGSLLAMARQAPAGRAPAAVGAKVTRRVTLPPAATVKGAAGAQVTEPGVPAHDEMPVTLSGTVLALCTWVLSDLEPPMATVWKSSEVGLRTIAGVEAVVTLKAGSATV